MPSSDCIRRLPVAQPLQSVDQLLNWTPPPEDPGTRPLVPSLRDKSAPKTLICHDMAGGYLQDRFIQGCEEPESYRFYHWGSMDIFVYFSHYFVTIPPPCWINSAHRHGVKVLGTIITEWDKGIRLCKKMLSSYEQADRSVATLVALCRHYQFDGWLINIENSITDKGLVDMMQYFLKSLTQAMHSALPGSEVIWYDSVTEKGVLKWQDSLNAHNRCYFDLCDGIFVNYQWNLHKLNVSLEHSGERRHDVYVGMDVFGRGMFGDGGFNTDLALEVIRSYDFSTAIFAPGWVYENNGKTHFASNEARFWKYLNPYLSSHFYENLPFSTDFCQGWGFKKYINGQVMTNTGWSDLGLQTLQPAVQFGRSGQMTLQYVTEDGFSQGGCLGVKFDSPNDTNSCRLFHTRLTPSGPVLVRFITKGLHPPTGCSLCLYLRVEDGDGEQVMVLPDAIDPSGIAMEKGEVLMTALSTPQASTLYPDSNGLEQSEWTTRLFLLGKPIIGNKVIHEIGVLCKPIGCEEIESEVVYLIGQIQIIPTTDDSLHCWPVMDVVPRDFIISPCVEKPEITELVEDEEEKGQGSSGSASSSAESGETEDPESGHKKMKAVKKRSEAEEEEDMRLASAVVHHWPNTDITTNIKDGPVEGTPAAITLDWDAKELDAHHFNIWCRFKSSQTWCTPFYLGSTTTSQYLVTDLHLPDKATNMDLYVQVVYESGVVQPLSTSGHCFIDNLDNKTSPRRYVS